MGQILTKSCQKNDENIQTSVKSKLEVANDLKKLEKSQNLIDQFPKYEDVYKYLEKKQHRVYGDIHILAETLDPSIQIAISESFFQNTFEFKCEDEKLKQMENQTQQHQNIIQLIKYFSYNHNSMCTTFHRLITVIEYHARDLSTELFFRKLLIEKKASSELQNTEETPQSKNSSIYQSSFSKGQKSLSTNNLLTDSQHKKKNSVFFGQNHINKNSTLESKKKSVLYVQEIFHPNKQNGNKDLSEESFNSQRELDIYFEDKRSNFNFSSTDNQFRFQEKEFVYIMKSLISALCFLQMQNKNHQCIRSSSIFIARDGTIKLTDPKLFNQSSIYNYIYKGQSVSGGYLSPLLVQNVEYSVIKPEHNPYKSDVFTLGVLLLEVAYLNKLDNYFDYTHKCIIDLDGLDMLIDGLSDIYSQQTLNIIQSMLEENEDKRPDFVSLAQKLGIFNESTNAASQLVRSDSSSLIYSNRASQQSISQNQKNIPQSTSIVLPPGRQSLSQSPIFNRSIQVEQISIQQTNSQVFQTNQQNINEQSSQNSKSSSQCQNLSDQQTSNLKNQQQPIQQNKQNQNQQSQQIESQQSNQNLSQKQQNNQDFKDSPKITKIETLKKQQSSSKIQQVTPFIQENEQNNQSNMDQQQKRERTPIRNATFAPQSPIKQPILSQEDQENINNPILLSTPKKQDQQSINESYRYMTPLPQIRLSTPDNTTIQKQLFQMNQTPIANTKKIQFSKDRGISTVKTESTATDIQFTQKTERTIDMQKYQARSTSPILRHQSSPSKQPNTQKSKINAIVVSEYSPNYKNNLQTATSVTDQNSQNRLSLSPMSKNTSTIPVQEQKSDKGGILTQQTAFSKDIRNVSPINYTQSTRYSINTPNDFLNKSPSIQIGTSEQQSNLQKNIIKDDFQRNSQPSVTSSTAQNQYQPKKSLSVVPQLPQLQDNLDYKFNNATPIKQINQQESQPTISRTYSTNNIMTMIISSRSPSPITSKSTQKIKRMISQADDKSPTGTPAQKSNQVRQSISQVQPFNSINSQKQPDPNKYLLSSLTPHSQKPPSLKSSQTQNKSLQQNSLIYTPTNQMGQIINGQQYTNSHSTTNRMSNGSIKNLSYNALNPQNTQSGINYQSVLNNHNNQKSQGGNISTNQRKSINVEPITHQRMSNSKIPYIDNSSKLGSYEQQSMQSSSNNKSQTNSEQLLNSTNQMQKSHRYSQSGNQFQYRSKTEIGNDQEYITSANQKYFDRFFDSSTKPPTTPEPIMSEKFPLTNQLANYQKQQSEQSYRHYTPRQSINEYKVGDNNNHIIQDKQQQNPLPFVDPFLTSYQNKLIDGLNNIKPAGEIFRNKNIQQSTDLHHKQSINMSQQTTQQKPPSLKSSLSLSKSQSSTKLNQQMTSSNTKTDLKQSNVGQKELTMSYIDRELEKHKQYQKNLEEDMQRQKQQQFALQTQMLTPQQMNSYDFTPSQLPKFEKEHSLNNAIDQHIRDCSHHLQATSSEISAPSYSQKQIPSQTLEEQKGNGNIKVDSANDKFFNQNHKENNDLKQYTYQPPNSSNTQFQINGNFITEQINNNLYNKTCTFGELTNPESMIELQKKDQFQEDEKTKMKSPPKEFNSDYIDELIARFKKQKTDIQISSDYNDNSTTNFRNQNDINIQTNSNQNQISQNNINHNFDNNIESIINKNAKNQVNYNAYNPYSSESQNSQNNFKSNGYEIDNYNNYYNIQIDSNSIYNNDNDNQFYNTNRDLNNEFSRYSNQNFSDNNNIENNNKIESQNNKNQEFMNNNNIHNKNNNINSRLNSITQNNHPNFILPNTNNVANTNGIDSNSNYPSSERAIKRVESSCVIPAPSYLGQPLYSQKAPLPLGSNKYRTSIGGNDDRRISQDYVAGSRGELYNIPKSPNSYIKQNFTEINSIPLSQQQRADALYGIDFQDLKGQFHEQLKYQKKEQNEQYDLFIQNQQNSGSSSVKQVNSMANFDKRQSRDRIASKDMTNSSESSVSNNNHSIQIILPSQDHMGGVQQQSTNGYQNNDNYGINLIEDQNFIENNIIGDLDYYAQQQQNQNGQFLQTNFSAQIARQQTFGPNSPSKIDAIQKGNLNQEQNQQLIDQVNSQTILNFPFNTFTQSNGQSNDNQENPSILKNERNYQRDSGIDSQIPIQKETFQQQLFTPSPDVVQDKDYQNQNTNFESTFAQNGINNYIDSKDQQQLYYESDINNVNHEIHSPQHTPFSQGNNNLYQLTITPPQNNSSFQPPIQEQNMYQHEQQMGEDPYMFIDDQQLNQQQQYINQMIEGCQNISNIQQVNEDDTKRSLEATDDVFLNMPSNQNLPDGGICTNNFNQEENSIQNNFYQNSEKIRNTTPFNLQPPEKQNNRLNYYNASGSKNNTFTISPKKDESMFNQTFSELQMIQFLKSKENVIETYEDGSYYEGEKMNGVRHGRGKFYYGDGGSFQGEWQNGHMNGYGILFYPSQQKAYEGEWDDDKFNGKGIMYNERPVEFNGMFNYHNMNEVQDYWIKYEGDFKDDFKNGAGTLYLSNGERYIGRFKNDMIHGHGTYYKIDGSFITAEWSQNILLNYQ